MFDHLEYNPETGEIYSHKKKRILKGYVNKDRGYRYHGTGGKLYISARLCWFLHYGEWPDGEIDHINRDRLDDRLCNLRVVNRRENNLNRKPQGRLKVRGVSMHKNKYKVQRCINGQQNYYGLFETLEEAAAKAKEVYGVHGEL